MTETTANTTQKKSIKKLFKYEWITSNTNFFLFLSVLVVLYIANGHLADKTIRNISKTQDEIKQLENEYKTIKSEVMYKSEEEQVLKAATPLGLRQGNETPERLQSEITK
jgi:cell division protein FtsL